MIILLVNDNRFKNMYAIGQETTITDKVPTRKDFFLSDDLVILNTDSESYLNFPEDAEIYSLTGFDDDRHLISMGRGVIFPIALPSNVNSLDYLTSDAFYQQMSKLNKGREQFRDLINDMFMIDPRLGIVSSISAEDLSRQLQKSDIQEIISGMDIAIDENRLYPYVCQALSAWNEFELPLI